MLAGAQAKGLEQVAFAGACLTGDDDVIVATDKVEATEFDEEGLVEGGLKIPVEGFQGLSLRQATLDEAVTDTANALVIDLDAKDVFEQGGVTGSILGGPVEQVIELAEGLV